MNEELGYNFLNQDDFKKLELFFANTNLSMNERKIIIDLLNNTRYHGFTSGSLKK